jgi:hypothetical protein
MTTKLIRRNTRANILWLIRASIRYGVTFASLALCDLNGRGIFTPHGATTPQFHEGQRTASTARRRHGAPLTWILSGGGARDTDNYEKSDVRM